ncbi:hypothetical protein [Arthrobacter sp. A2-55]|uniref:hypothetical protein n=1 Tax=Arthrobacter sp. A2-55 TaxID=2897337 RepID=UPI0021CD7BBE|nr:hypothetical protein [Arthrobacter sp. A2-55]MCU6481918.1 hypothetical protein [Arthrobacter sp. A2-55]
MSEKNWKERVSDDRTKDSQEISNWMFGNGTKVLGGIAVLLGIWFLVTAIWG